MTRDELEAAIAQGRSGHLRQPPWLKDLLSESEENNENYHRIPLGPEQIVDVDTPEAFEKMCDVLQSQYMLAMDCEFYISTAENKSVVALMQIACQDQVFLIDMHKLIQNDHCQGLWKNLLEKGFSDPKLLLAYDPRCDLKTLVNTSSEFSELSRK